MVTFSLIILADSVTNVTPTRAGRGVGRGAVNSNINAYCMVTFSLIILADFVTNVAQTRTGKAAVNSNINAYCMVTFH